MKKKKLVKIIAIIVVTMIIGQGCSKNDKTAETKTNITKAEQKAEVKTEEVKTEEVKTEDNSKSNKEKNIEYANAVAPHWTLLGYWWATLSQICDKAEKTALQDEDIMQINVMLTYIKEAWKEISNININIENTPEISKEKESLQKIQDVQLKYVDLLATEIDNKDTKILEQGSACLEKASQVIDEEANINLLKSTK